MPGPVRTRALPLSNHKESIQWANEDAIVYLSKVRTCQCSALQKGSEDRGERMDIQSGSSLNHTAVPEGDLVVEFGTVVVEDFERAFWWRCRFSVCLRRGLGTDDD
jgi:hypothetical protein